MRPETLDRANPARNVRQSPALVTPQLLDAIEETGAPDSAVAPGSPFLAHSLREKWGTPRTHPHPLAIH
jgi:hypothetical protein